jgi:hypothetical protein
MAGIMITDPIRIANQKVRAAPVLAAWIGLLLL